MICSTCHHEIRLGGNPPCNCPWTTCNESKPETLAVEGEWSGAATCSASSSITSFKECDDRSHWSFVAKEGDRIVVDRYHNGEVILLIRRGELTEICDI